MQDNTLAVGTLSQAVGMDSVALGSMALAESDYSHRGR
jgi:hypothetical protein